MAAVDDEPGEWMNTVEVARLFSVHIRTVRKWADEGRLPCERGKRGARRFPRAEIKTLRVNASNGCVAQMGTYPAEPVEVAPDWQPKVAKRRARPPKAYVQFDTDDTEEL